MKFQSILTCFIHECKIGFATSCVAQSYHKEVKEPETYEHQFLEKKLKPIRFS